MVKMWRNWNPRNCWWNVTWGSCLGNQFGTDLPCDPAIPLLGARAREMKAYVYTDTCTWVFTAAFVIIAPNVETT